MEQIASDGHRTFFLRVLTPDERLGIPFGGAPYPAMVWSMGLTTATQKHQLCADLIGTGCRYLVCGGVECRAWEDAADEERDLAESVGLDFVMTTSHRGEPEDEVAFFFVHLTNSDQHEFTRYLIVLVGSDDPVKARLTAAVREELNPSSRAGLPPGE